MSEIEEKPKNQKRKKVSLDPRLSEYRGIWVFIEQEEAKVHPVSWELLGKACVLAKFLGVDVGAVVFGGNQEVVDTISKDAIAYGADIVYQVVDPSLADYRSDPFTECLVQLVKKYKPEILLLGATSLSRDLASSVATFLETGLTADCTELTINLENRSLEATRPTFGGSLLCTILTLNYRPQMATVRPGVFPIPLPNTDRKGMIIREQLQFNEASFVTKVLGFIPDPYKASERLSQADVVIGGGRGLKQASHFSLLRELAMLLGGEVGGTRPVVQAGWLEAERQIGQTGKTIRPKVYIAVGISGAVQHRVGIEKAGTIVAINNDPNAPIFDYADIGIVGDFLEVIPAMIRVVKNKISLKYDCLKKQGVGKAEEL
ncbi:electron transfer flavoprotein subunit alpha/FixB family protein [Candidatus Methylacidiphilum fumarolicum]|uniref:Protein fixB n=2 Tax=Candidatus Methylacidiphilum fumarolicum TaxID=591154 RepID=I0JYP7_METFB|nr:electron transfer flavoprotein subunit alpha/FixB family protein [Candidatus Methylacidiphilum fumarolicum]MBW6415080.1 electron transfer flavoprotein subunit alpha/FixB family protein [Candidatus Methylacidiphilum fumarolicum]TFE69689.1 electron transfer flavoprotein subunit alpha [Candidatus Methylacidiphilum fumarolicum]TFE74844.1 electron transfer flavoprotein subunit alpha/FixB family protein [Candidatus Methylacidiphilum fumarolicum]TFE75489.1 electron transfer flavoprotein subunit alp